LLSLKGKFELQKKTLEYFLKKSIFPLMKIARIKQTSKALMLSRLKEGGVLLPPLVVKSFSGLETNKMGDARMELTMPGGTERFRFVVESKARATPQSIQLAMAQARSAAQGGEWPLIQVPFLSEERLKELEREGVSGVDLCGNGVVIVPRRLYVMRTGAPNRYRDSRPLSNPYRGRSAMVARMLLQCPEWKSLSSLAEALEKNGAKLSLPQVSKAVQALCEDLIASKRAGVITLKDPVSLLDRLGTEWRGLELCERAGLRLPPRLDWAAALSSNPMLKWAMTGESSVTRYAMFSQGGARRIAVSNLRLSMNLLGGQPEPVPNFADVELLETEEPGLYFGNEVDERGVRWASRLQTWLELQSGDPRQQAAAKDLRSQILKEARE
jgi:hypothetical protein